MVEIVVSLANRNQRSYEMVTRGVLIVEGSLAEPVGKRVYTKRRLRRILENATKQKWQNQTLA
jgi:hypothetical protein